MLVSALGNKRKCGQAESYILDFNKQSCEANVSLPCTLEIDFVYLFVICIKCTVNNCKKKKEKNCNNRDSKKRTVKVWWW